MIHQFYFTHCTYSTSALERKTGDVAQHPLGYSARSASVSKEILRDIFRKLERYVYYYLPSDTPAADKERILPSKAPFRLVFLPETECGPVLLHLSYRPKDTAGRIGSYFCHALASDLKNGNKESEGKTALSAVSALQLWGASGWVLEETNHMPHDIPALNSLSSLLQNVSPAIDERLLASFLRTESGEDFADPKNIIPERWKRMPAAERQHYFKLAIFGFLSVCDTAGASLLLVAEPSVAAILFYGINLFLPKKLIRNVSFSTYEPNPERLFTKLSATTFQNPDQNDLPEKFYAGHSFVLNTWNGRSTDFDAGRLASSYVTHAWKQFLAGGTNQVQIFSQTFGAVGVSSAVDLNAMMMVEKLFHQILADDEIPATSENRLPLSLKELPVTSSKMALTLLKRRLADGISKIMKAPLPEAEKQLGRIVGTPGQLLLLELLGTGGNLPPVQNAVRYLAETLPEKYVGIWLQNSSAGDDFKAKILVRWLQAKRTLPTGCEFLWKLTANSMESACSSETETVPGPKPPVQNAKILPLALHDLSAKLLLECFQSPNVRDFQKEMVIACSLGVSSFVEREGALGEKALEIRQNLDQFIQNVPESLCGEIYRTYGNWFFLNYPGDSQFLGEKFASLEETLYRTPDEIAAKTRILFDIQDILPEDTAPRIRRWRALRKAMQAVTTFQAQPGKKVQSRPLDQACEGLAQTAYELFDDVRLLAECGGKKAAEFEKIGKISNAQRNRLAEKEMELLASLCRQWFSVKFLPEGNRTHDLMLKKIKFYFQTKKWNNAKVSVLGNQAIILMILGGIGIGLLAVLLFFLFLSGSNPSQTSALRSEENPAEIRAEVSSDPDEDEEDEEDFGVKNPAKTKKDKGSSKSAKDKNSKSSSVKNDSGEKDSDSLNQEPAEETYEMETGDPAKPDIKDELSELSAAETESAETQKNHSEDPEILTVNEFQNEAEKTPEKLFLETSPETLESWNREIEKDGFLRRVSLPMRSFSISGNFEPKNNELNYALVTRNSIQDIGQFTSAEIQNLKLVGGYVLFEGTAFPFGENPACVTPPSPNPEAVESGAISNLNDSSAPKKAKHVLRREALEKTAVKDEPGRLYHIQEIPKILGIESFIVEMLPNEENLPFLYVRVQKHFADSKARLNRAEVEEQISVLEKQTAELRSARAACQRKVYDQKLRAALEKLADLTGKRVLLALPEVKDPQNHEQVEAYQNARSRLISQKIPQLLEIAADRIEQNERKLEELRDSIPAESGWTPAEIQRINERLIKNPPRIMAVFSGNFYFNLPLPAKANQLLKQNASAPSKKKPLSSSLIGETENSSAENGDETFDSLENDDPFGQVSLSTGIQPLNLEEIKGGVKILQNETDFEMTLKTGKKIGNIIQIKLEGMGRKLPENINENVLVSMRAAQIRAEESKPRYQMFHDLTSDGDSAEIQLLPEVKCLLITFQISGKSAGENSLVCLTPYYQIWFADEDEDEEERKLRTLTLKLSPEILNSFIGEESVSPKSRRKTSSQPKDYASPRGK